MPPNVEKIVQAMLNEAASCIEERWPAVSAAFKVAFEEVAAQWVAYEEGMRSGAPLPRRDWVDEKQRLHTALAAVKEDAGAWFGSAINFGLQAGREQLRLQVSAPDFEQTYAFLVEDGILSQEDLRAAIQARGKSNSRLVPLLLTHSKVSQRELADRIARRCGLPYDDLGDREPNAYLIYPFGELDTFRSGPQEVAKRMGLVPVAIEDDMLVVASSDPLCVPINVLETLGEATREQGLITGNRLPLARFVVTREEALNRFIDELSSKYRDEQAKSYAPSFASSEPETADAEATVIEKVHPFSGVKARIGVSIPLAASPGSHFMARFAAYAPYFETKVQQLLTSLSPRSGNRLGLRTCSWETGTRVRVDLRGAQLDVSSESNEFEWQGAFSVVDFDVTVRADAPLGVTVVAWEATVEGIPVARISVDLQLETSATAMAVQRRTMHLNSLRTAFASYAAEDRKRVADRLDAVQIATGMDVFMDCLSLHPGEEWQPRLEREIGQRDLFLLFWSNHARESKAVEWEWKTAVHGKGLEGLQIHPLESASVAPLPPELQHLHLSSQFLLVYESVPDPPSSSGRSSG